MRPPLIAVSTAHNPPNASHTQPSDLQPNPYTSRALFRLSNQFDYPLTPRPVWRPRLALPCTVREFTRLPTRLPASDAHSNFTLAFTPRRCPHYVDRSRRDSPIWAFMASQRMPERPRPEKQGPLRRQACEAPRKMGDTQGRYVSFMLNYTLYGLSLYPRPPRRQLERLPPTSRPPEIQYWRQ